MKTRANGLNCVVNVYAPIPGPSPWCSSDRNLCVGSNSSGCPTVGHGFIQRHERPRVRAMFGQNKPIWDEKVQKLKRSLDLSSMTGKYFYSAIRDTEQARLKVSNKSSSITHPRGGSCRSEGFVTAFFSAVFSG